MSGNQYVGNIQKIADHLHYLADRIKHEGTATLRAEPLDTKRAALNAATVVHTVQWGFANLPLQNMLDSIEAWREDEEADAHM